MIFAESPQREVILSSEELGLILETGGFSSINDTKDSPQEAPKQGRLRKKKTRKLGVSRRGGGKESLPVVGTRSKIIGMA